MTYSVAVAGASGYAGGELLRLARGPPRRRASRTVTAHSNAGQPLIAVQPHLRSLAHLTLRRHERRDPRRATTSCSSRCRTARRASSPSTSRDTLVIDCGADHRLDRAPPTGRRSTAATSTAPGPTACPSSCAPVGHASATGSPARTAHRGARLQRRRPSRWRSPPASSAGVIDADRPRRRARRRAPRARARA